MDIFENSVTFFCLDTKIWRVFVKELFLPDYNSAELLYQICLWGKRKLSLGLEFPTCTKLPAFS